MVKVNGLNILTATPFETLANNTLKVYIVWIQGDTGMFLENTHYVYYKFVYFSLNFACMSRGQVARYIEFEHCLPGTVCNPFFFLSFHLFIFLHCSFNSCVEVFELQY